jgi:hypothetical protein
VNMKTLMSALMVAGATLLAGTAVADDNARIVLAVGADTGPRGEDDELVAAGMAVIQVDEQGAAVDRFRWVDLEAFQGTCRKLQTGSRLRLSDRCGLDRLTYQQQALPPGRYAIFAFLLASDQRQAAGCVANAPVFDLPAGRATALPPIIIRGDQNAVSGVRFLTNADGQAYADIVNARRYERAAENDLPLRILDMGDWEGKLVDCETYDLSIPRRVRGQ